MAEMMKKIGMAVSSDDPRAATLKRIGIFYGDEAKPATPTRGNYGGSPPAPLQMPQTLVDESEEDRQRRLAASGAARGTILDDKTDKLGDG